MPKPKIPTKDKIDDITDIIKLIISNIVDKPSEVVVAKTKKDGIVKLTVACSQDDLGKVIGKKGQTINAIRTLVRVIGVHQNHEITKVELTEFA